MSFTLPYDATNSTIAAGQYARANHINDNFAAIETELNAVGTSGAIKDGAVTHDKIANDAVDIDKLLIDAGAFAFGGNKITNLADPTSAQDAATVTYVKTKAWTPASAYAGEQSITFPNGLIVKLGNTPVNANSNLDVVYSNAFSAACTPLLYASYASIASDLQSPCGAIAKEGALNTTATLVNGHGSTAAINWLAIGY